MCYDWARMVTMAARKTEFRTISVRMPTEIHEALAQIAGKEDRTLNSQIVRCLRECVIRVEGGHSPPEAAPPSAE